MDVSQINLKVAAEEGITVNLMHPTTGEPLKDEKGKSIAIIVLGKDSEKWQSVAKLNNTKNSSRYKNKPVPQSALETTLYDILAECTVSWSDSIEFDAVKLKCTKENALMMYQERNWIAEQVLEAAGDRANLFLK